MSLQGFAVTAAGRNLFAKLTARSEPVEFTRVMFGTGKLADNADIFNVTELVSPLAEGTGTTPEYKDDTVSMILEFRSDLNGGLTETVWLNEYGLYASDPDGGEVLVCYGNLGDCPDSVLAFKNGQCTVRDYPISIVIGAISDVSIDFPAAAFVTWEGLNELINKRIHVIRSRVRDPDKPDYSDEDGAVTMKTSGYTGTAEIAAMVNGTLYDADNMKSTIEVDTPNGTLIVKKEEQNA